MDDHEISAQQLQQMIDDSAENVTVIDVRDKNRYDAGHVPGAHHIPLKSMQQAVPDLPEDGIIVTYCGGGQSGVTAAGLLREHGYDARVMEGFRAWESQGMPVGKNL